MFDLLVKLNAVLMVAKTGGRLEVSKPAVLKFCMERINLRYICSFGELGL
jgi:hypothetical protein